MALFLQGLILGFLIAAPVGPIGVLCIRRTLAHGRRSGFVSGLGTATADAIYGCIAAFGMTAAGQLLFAYQPALRLGGGLFLLYLGWGILRAKPPVFAGEDGSVRLIGDYVSAFILTLTNPLTIMTFAAVFAGVGIGESGGIYGLALLLVGGVLVAGFNHYGRSFSHQAASEQAGYCQSAGGESRDRFWHFEHTIVRSSVTCLLLFTDSSPG